MTATLHLPLPRAPVLRTHRPGAVLASVGAGAGVVAGIVELALGPQIRSWVGNKEDTTRLGLATIMLGVVAAVAAATWVRSRRRSIGERLLVVVALLVPGAIGFTTAGRSWYVPGVLLILAAAVGAVELRHDAVAVRAAISRSWIVVLGASLALFYTFLGATALGLAGALGVAGGVVVLGALATSARIPRRAGPVVLLVAVLPFAVLTWWTIVTPLLAILIVTIGSPALRRTRRATDRAG